MGALSLRRQSNLGSVGPCLAWDTFNRTHSPPPDESRYALLYSTSSRFVFQSATTTAKSLNIFIENKKYLQKEYSVYKNSCIYADVFMKKKAKQAFISSVFYQ